MLNIQGLFIDTDHTAKNHRVVNVSERVRGKRNSLQVKFRLQPLECLGSFVLRRLMNYCMFSCKSCKNVLSKVPSSKFPSVSVRCPAVYQRKSLKFLKTSFVFFSFCCLFRLKVWKLVKSAGGVLQHTVFRGNIAPCWVTTESCDYLSVNFY